MRISVVQSRPLPGDIGGNLARHLHLSKMALEEGAELVVFPELSLTGYAPQRCQALATPPQDPVLQPLQRLSDLRGLVVGVGLPTRQPEGVCISVVLVRPGKDREVYSKRFLHPDEEAYFVPGQAPPPAFENARCALAICFEISVEQHLREATAGGAQVYIASVAKTSSGVSGAVKRLASIARKSALAVLMTNSVGDVDGFISAGGSSVWDSAGNLRQQLDDKHEGLITFDTATGECVARQLVTRA